MTLTFAVPERPSPPISHFLRANCRVNCHWIVRIFHTVQEQGLRSRSRTRRQCPSHDSRGTRSIRCRARDPPHLPRRPSIAPQDNHNRICGSRRCCASSTLRRVGYTRRQCRPPQQGSRRCTALARIVLRVDTSDGGHLLHVLHELEPVSDSPSCGCCGNCRFPQWQQGSDGGAGAPVGWTEMMMVLLGLEDGLVFTASCWDSDMRIPRKRGRCVRQKG